MFDLNNVTGSLDEYLDNLDGAGNEITLFGDLRDDNNEPQAFLRIRKHDDRYQVQFADQEGDWQDLTQASLNREHLSVGLVANDIHQYNRRQRGLFYTLIGWAIDDLRAWRNRRPIEADGAFVYQGLPKTAWQLIIMPFTWLNAGLKWVARKLILDNSISKYLFGNIIATIANRENPHYKIEAKRLSETLGTLIFPGGLQAANVNDDARIYLGPVLGIQHRVYHAFHQNPNDYPFQSFKVRVGDDMELDGIEGDNGLDITHDSLHLIYFNGNSGCYEDCHHVVQNDLRSYRDKNLPVKAIQYNHPGVLKSTGHVQQAEDLFQAGIAQVERLHQQGVPYDRIGLHGVSLGGSIVSHVASYYHARGIELAGTYASKTFSSTTNVAVSYVQRVPYVGSLLGFILRPLIAFGLWGARWQMDTAAHFSGLPRERRDYSLVRSSQLLRDNYEPIDDPVLNHYASLHESWRLRLQRFFHKRGWFSYDSETYKRDNDQRKMSVFSHMPNVVEAVYSPQICGHSAENRPDVTLYHRNWNNSLQGDALFFPESGDLHDMHLTSGVTSKQRIQGFFSRRMRGEEAPEPVIETLGL